MISRLASLISQSLLSGLFGGLEDYARPVLLWLLPEGWYRPGVGALAVLALVLAVGILARNTLLKRLLDLVTRALEALPVLGPLYRALQDLSAMLADDGSRSTSRPVMVHVPGLEISMLALELPQGVDVRLPPSKDQVLLYLPMTYQIGGVMVRVPRGWVAPLDLSSLEARPHNICGGIGGDREPSATGAESASGQD